jgi:hypothetical protein
VRTSSGKHNHNLSNAADWYAQNRRAW